MKTKRVLFVHEAIVTAGTEKVLLDIFKNIDRNIFSPYFTGSKKADSYFLNKLKKLDVPYILISIGYLKKTLNPLLLLQYAINLIRATIILCLYIIKNNIEIIHINSLYSAFYIFLASIITKRPIIWHEHGIEHFYYLRSLIFRFLDKKVIKYIANCKAAKDALIKLGIKKDKITIIYNAVDTRDIFKSEKIKPNPFINEYNLPENCKLVSLVGQLARGKGHEYFIKAASIISQRKDDIFFLIIGNKDNSAYTRSLYRLVADLRLKSRVFFHEWIYNIEELYCFLDIVTVCTFTSEGCNKVVLEAISALKPVVATNIGGIPEIVENEKGGLLVAPKDEYALADAIIKLVENPEYTYFITKNAKENIEKRFNMEVFIGKIEKFYNELLNAPKD